MYFLEIMSLIGVCDHLKIHFSGVCCSSVQKKLLIKSWFHGNFWEWSRFVAQNVKKMRNSLSPLIKISSNQLFSNFFSKTIAFTRFLRKKCEREFLQFPHCALWTAYTNKCQILTFFCKKVNQSIRFIVHLKRNVNKYPRKELLIKLVRLLFASYFSTNVKSYNYSKIWSYISTPLYLN